MLYKILLICSIQLISYVIITLDIWIHYWKHIENYTIWNVLFVIYYKHDDDSYDDLIEDLMNMRFVPLAAQYYAMISSIDLIYNMMRHIFKNKCIIKRDKRNDTGGSIK